MLLTEESFTMSLKPESLVSKNFSAYVFFFLLLNGLFTSTWFYYIYSYKKKKKKKSNDWFSNLFSGLNSSSILMKWSYVFGFAFVSFQIFMTISLVKNKWRYFEEWFSSYSEI